MSQVHPVGFEIGESVIFQKLNDEIVVLNLENQNYFGLDNVGAEMWEDLAGMNNDELKAIYSGWNDGPLQSYLIEITASVFSQWDELTDHYLVDMIMDSAHQKGTGMWMSQDAMNQQFPIPVIDAAVSARDLSAFKDEPLWRRSD